MSESSECEHDGETKECQACHEQVCSECSYECGSKCGVCKWCWMTQYYEVEGSVCTACYIEWHETVFMSHDSSSE